MEDAPAIVESIFTWFIVGGALGAGAAQYKGRDLGYGALCGCMLGPIALILFHYMDEAIDTSVKKCPHCAELVLVEAKVCKHCGRDILDARTKTVTARSGIRVNVPGRRS